MNKGVHILKKEKKMYPDVHTETAQTLSDNKMYSTSKLADPFTFRCKKYNFGLIPTLIT